MKKKRLLSLLIAFIMLLSAAAAFTVPAKAVVRSRRRQINIVYDDSGSMASNERTRWSQAKYAMEVFVAMMGTGDRITIFPMSAFSYRDFGGENGDQSSTWGKVVELSGDEPVEERIGKIDRMNGDNGIYRNTPIGSVEAAGNNLRESDADEKWLVILTDGEFDTGKNANGAPGEAIPPEITNKTITGYADNKTKVAYVAIAIEEDKAKLLSTKKENYFPFEAKEETILQTVTQVARTVYNYKNIPVSGTRTKIVSPDIPVSKFVVFAQGKDVEIGELKLQGAPLDCDTSSAEVGVPQNTKYRPQNGYNIKIADGLNGKVVTYTCKDESRPFAPGDYEFTANSNNVEVYFEPGVEIQAILESSSGGMINLSEDSVQALEEGLYTVHLRMVNPLTGEEVRITDTELLSETELSVIVKDQNGNVTEYKDGDVIEIREGSVEITAKAVFNGGEIEKDSETHTYEVYNSGLRIVFDNGDSFRMAATTLELSEPITFRMEPAGDTPLTEEELDALEFEATGISGVIWEFEKLDESGRFRMTPKFKDSQGAAAIAIGSYPVTVVARRNAEGYKQTGHAVCNIECYVDSSLQIRLTMEAPEPKYPEDADRKIYTYDPKKLSEEEGAEPVILRAEILNSDGTSRPLSDYEWRKGIENLTVSTEQDYDNVFREIVKFIYHQSLDFEARLGEEPSSYLLYPKDKFFIYVAPETTKLTAEMSIMLENGIMEKGADEGEVSVMPLSFAVYLGWLIAMLIFLLLMLSYGICLVRKKRFPIDMSPVTDTMITAGIPMPGEQHRSRRRIRHRFWPPTAPEEWKVQMRSDEGWNSGTNGVVTLTFIAAGGGDFKLKSKAPLTNVVSTETDFGNRVSVMVAGKDLEVFDVNSHTLNKGHTIRVNVASTSGGLKRTAEIVLSFVSTHKPGGGKVQPIQHRKRKSKRGIFGRR